jgi:hypothetical protein
MSDSTHKIGAGSLSAMGRQGLNELRAVFFPDSNIAQPTEAGMYGTATPAEVAKSRDTDMARTEAAFGAVKDHVVSMAKDPSAFVDRIKSMYGSKDADRGQEKENASPAQEKEAKEPEKE